MASSISPAVGWSHSLRGGWILTRLVMPHAFRHGSKLFLPKVLIKANLDIPTGIPETWAVAGMGLDDGRDLSEQYRHYRGSIANPMSRDEYLGKVRARVRRSLQSADVERVIGMVETLKTLPDLR
jgi:hypothetical protein